MKKSISHWDFSQYQDKTLVKSQLVEPRGWQANASWLLPQLLALLGSGMQLACTETQAQELAGAHTERAIWGFTPMLRNLGHPLDPKLTTLQYDTGMPVTKAAFQGMLNVLNHCPRGEILPITWKQNTELGARYSAAVPLFLSAFKEFRSIPYSSWDYTDPCLSYFVDQDMLDYLAYVNKPLPWTREELLEFREQGRTIRSGAKSGTQKPVTHTTSLSAISDPNFKALPRLLKLALCQTWVYHPIIRHKFMITDHMNLDTPPQPLVSGEVFAATPTQQSSMWNV